MSKSIKIRTASGSVKEEVELVRVENCGFRSTHNGDGSYERLVGWDADGTKYETSSRRGWRRALDQSQSTDQ